MLSEEKTIHIVHLIIDGIWKEDLVDYPDEDEAMREAKKICLQFMKQLDGAGEAAIQRIRTQKNPPRENTPAWENLYSKYFDEETRKRGG